MSELTDLEICKRIAEIDDAVETLITNTDRTLTAVFENRTTFDYNPLANDALCFQLMVKYRIKLIYEQYPDYYHALIKLTSICESSDNPNKAICLAIIEANK